MNLKKCTIDDLIFVIEKVDKQKIKGSEARKYYFIYKNFKLNVKKDFIEPEDLNGDIRKNAGKNSGNEILISQWDFGTVYGFLFIAEVC